MAVLLRERGWEVSTSMVGRILTHLKARGVLREPPSTGISTRKRPWRRHYAVRKPRGYEAKNPGDLVQVDTLDVRPLPGGVVLKHFTARDVVSRWDVVEVHTRATATLAAGFLDTIQQRMPFPVRAIQVDGGSEFQAGFEQACQERNIRLFVLPPRSPKLNGCVERAQRTHTEEFYEVNNFPLEIAPPNQKLRHWELTYNTIRPHQALGYLTPRAFCQLWMLNHPSDKEDGTAGKHPPSRLPPTLQLYHIPPYRRSSVTNLLDEYIFLTWPNRACTLMVSLSETGKSPSELSSDGDGKIWKPPGEIRGMDQE